MSSLLDALGERAAKSPHRHAILAPEREPATSVQLFEQVLTLADELRAARMHRASVVALAVPSGPDLATAFLGTMTVAACAPLAVDRPRAEHERDLAAMGATALLVIRDHETPARDAAEALDVPVMELEPSARAGCFDLAWADPARTIAPSARDTGDAALLLFTSGTTSRPKLVPLPEAHLLRSAGNVAATLGLTSDDRCLEVMPLFHVHGIVAGLLAPLIAGGSVVCTPGFHADRVWKWIREYQPTWYTAVPTIHQAMVDASRPLVEHDRPIASSLRFVRSSSAAMPARLMTELESVLGVPVVEAYGMTEAAHQIASNPLPPATRRPGSVGRPTGCEVEVRSDAGRPVGPGEVGEVVVRGPSIAARYLGDADATAAAFHDGWFRTGDQGRLDADGFLTLTGRLKEIINRGGEKVAPREIDDVLLGHPDVVHAVAFGVPHPRLGEEVAAAVVLRDGARVTAAQLRLFAAETLAPYKVPRRVVAVDEIPRGATGKLDRSGMAAQLGLAAGIGRGDGPRVEPVDGLERDVAAIWQDVLGEDELPSTDADFFELGGDSLHATVLLQEVERVLGRRLPATVFLHGATIRSMAAMLRAEPEDPTVSSIVPVQPEGARPPLFCVMRAGSIVTLRHFVPTLGPDQPVLGVWMPAMHGRDEESGSIEDLAAECVRLVRGARPEGPYLLFGHSLGAVVVFEAARLLAADGHDVAFVGMADALHPRLVRAQWARRHSTRYRLRKLVSRKGFRVIAWRVRKLFGRIPPKPVVYLPGTDVVVDWPAALARERAYEPGPAPVPVVIFATRQYLDAAKTPDLGWASVCAAGWESIEVPGSHDSMIGEPHVYVLAAHLAASLADAARAHPFQLSAGAPD